MKAATLPRVARRLERDREERTLLNAVALAADRFVDNAPGATYRTLEATVRALREWRRRQGRAS